jgi:hypothetical protein
MGLSLSPVAQQGSPLIGFGILFYHHVTMIDQFLQIRIQIKFIYQFPDPTVWRFIIDNIDYNSSIVNGLKKCWCSKNLKSPLIILSVNVSKGFISMIFDVKNLVLKRCFPFHVTVSSLLIKPDVVPIQPLP